MREGRLRTGLRIAVSTAIGLWLALATNYLALAQPGQTSPARDPAAVPPYPLEGEAVSEPPAALDTVACSSESFGKNSSHLKLAMGFGFRNVTATDVEARTWRTAPRAYTG